MAFIKYCKIKGIKYAYLVVSNRKGKEVRHKFVKYLGRADKLADKLTEPKADEISYFSSYDYADINVLFKVSQELNLIPIINNNTTKGGGIDVGQLSLIITINHCVNAKSKLQITKWFSRIYLPKLLSIYPNKINKDILTRVLDYLTEERITKIEKEIAKQLEKLFKLNKECLIYDVTSTYVYGNKCEIAKYGYNRDHVPEKQINFGLILSKIGKFPLMHKIFQGNTVDVTTLCSTTDDIKKQLNINTCMLILDRGMISEDNLVYLDKLRYGYIAGLSKAWKTTQELILEAKNLKLVDEEKLIYAEENIRLHNGQKKKYVVFLSKEKKKEDKERRERILKQKIIELNKLKERIEKGKIKNRDKIVMKIGEITKEARKYFNIKHDKNKLMFDFSLNQLILSKEERLDGCYVVCCTDINMSAEEILLAYRDKDKAEKAFKCIKCFIKVRPIRHWKDNRVRAHIFLCVLAYLLHKVLEYKLELKDLNITAQEAINELSGIKMISYKVGNKIIDKATKINDKQKLILEKLGYFPFK
jgi:transposase